MGRKSSGTAWRAPLPADFTVKVSHGAQMGAQRGGPCCGVKCNNSVGKIYSQLMPKRRQKRALNIAHPTMYFYAKIKI
jgi:hypothetical protein